MKQFILMIDASGLGAGSVLMQSDSQGVERPICYFSRKFDSHQKKHLTNEKETLTLVLSLKHFDTYLNTTRYPILRLMVVSREAKKGQSNHQKQNARQTIDSNCVSFTRANVFVICRHNHSQYLSIHVNL